MLTIVRTDVTRGEMQTSSAEQLHHARVNYLAIERETCRDVEHHREERHTHHRGSMPRRTADLRDVRNEPTMISSVAAWPGLSLPVS